MNKYYTVFDESVVASNKKPNVLIAPKNAAYDRNRSNYENKGNEELIRIIAFSIVAVGFLALIFIVVCCCRKFAKRREESFDESEAINDRVNANPK